MNDTQKFSALVGRLGVVFRDITLLERALTHSSAHATEKNNERLEFLGDRVLGLVVAELLHEKFPSADEGELAQRFNKLVRREACVEIAQKIDLGPFLILGSGEDSRSGRAKPSILADACEALLGAIFLDQGFDVVRQFIRTEWMPLLDKSDHFTRDAKSALQEWAQGRNLDLPRYELVSREGPDHAPEFTVEVRIDGIEPAQARGSSKRSAEQAAAQLVMTRENIANEE